MSIVHERCQADHEPGDMKVVPGQCEAWEQTAEYSAVDTFAEPCEAKAAIHIYVSDDPATPSRTLWLCARHSDLSAWPLYGDVLMEVAR